MKQSFPELELLDAERGIHENNDVRSTRAIPRMLIADDDPAILQLLADRCARIGFQVDVASNGMQAILKASRSKPDILVIDVNMPEVDGLSVCARLLDPEQAPVDAIVITGSRNPDMIERCEGFGVQYSSRDRPSGASSTPRSSGSNPRMACSDNPAVVVTDHFMPNGAAEYWVRRSDGFFVTVDTSSPSTRH